jgi:hypothetical protein
LPLLGWIGPLCCVAFDTLNTIMHISNNYTIIYLLAVSAYPCFWKMPYQRIAVSVSTYPYRVSMQRSSPPPTCATPRPLHCRRGHDQSLVPGYVVLARHESSPQARPPRRVTRREAVSGHRARAEPGGPNGHLYRQLGRVAM